MIRRWILIDIWFQINEEKCKTVQMVRWCRARHNRCVQQADFQWLLLMQRLFSKNGTSPFSNIYHPILKRIELQLEQLFLMICITENFVTGGLQDCCQVLTKKTGWLLLENCWKCFNRKMKICLPYCHMWRNLGTKYDTWDQIAKQSLENIWWKRFQKKSMWNHRQKTWWQPHFVGNKIKVCCWFNTNWKWMQVGLVKFFTKLRWESYFWD